MVNIILSLSNKFILFMLNLLAWILGGNVFYTSSSLYMVMETIADFFFFCNAISLSNFYFSALFIVSCRPLFLSAGSCCFYSWFFAWGAPVNLLVECRLYCRDFSDELTASEDLRDDRKVMWLLGWSYWDFKG